MTKHRLIAAGLAAALTALSPVAALAQTDERPVVESERPAAERERPSVDLENVKDRAQAAIERRLVTIDRLQSEVRSNPHVTDSHATTLLRELETAESGLQALGREIAAAETIEELRVLIPEIAEDYRIYVLMVPKVYEVLGSDTVAHVVGRFDTAAEELGEAIRRAEDAGYDVSEAEAYLAEMIRQAGKAESLGVPVAGSVLVLQPSDWPDPAKTVLRSGHADLDDARSALRSARQAAHDALEALREAIGGSDTDV